MARRSYNSDLEVNQELITQSEFLKNYNISIPASFPKATVRDLNQFQKAHPSLFRGSALWSIDKHRKRVMDWLPLHLSK